MTGPVVHELTTTVLLTGDEIFDVGEFTEKDLTVRLVRDAPCLEGDEDRVMVTSTPCSDPPAVFAFPHSHLYRARAICRTPYKCALLRKADR
ncbi:hypothetical protein QFZ75_007934 [Streptomyces sp. V3I8]|uniref:hypothetical protein n=1 Tax=Streptomyces sp. V3I8 TaxID=3042279 RepID=UPI00278308BE|nr:hypothetical protein [Streptomyces sp. V3I8]MDQ1041432.1 hypothetical protein [Streptomyces sp. V3I8]